MANVGNCSQLCTNTIGSYVCSCLSGYVLTADGSSCNGKNYLSACIRVLSYNETAIFKFHVYAFQPSDLYI